MKPRHVWLRSRQRCNLALSLRRGEAVKQALIAQGIPANAISIIGRGESQPLVPTADGVRALFRDPNGKLRGFALVGAATKDKQALTKDIPPLL